MKKKLTDKQLLSKIKKAVKEKKIEIAPQTEVEKYYEFFYDDFMPNILKIKGALITDMSSLGDFCYDKKELKVYFKRIKERYDLHLFKSHLIIDIMKMIFSKRD